MLHEDEIQYDRRSNLLINRLPEWIQKTIKWLRKPSSVWVRIPTGVICIFGGFLFILPLFGLWMLPLGLILLSEDAPPIKSLVGHMLEWIERKHPKWLGL